MGPLLPANANVANHRYQYWCAGVHCDGYAKEELLLCIVLVVSVLAAEGDSVHLNDGTACIACCMHLCLLRISPELHLAPQAALSIIHMVVEGGVCACLGVRLQWLPRSAACVLVMPNHCIVLLLCLTLCAVHSTYAVCSTCAYV